MQLFAASLVLYLVERGACPRLVLGDGSFGNGDTKPIHSGKLDTFLMNEEFNVSDYESGYENWVRNGSKTREESINDISNIGKPGYFVCQANCWGSEVDAHMAAAREYSPKSIANRLEYSWNVYMHHDGTYTYTYPNISDVQNPHFVKRPTVFMDKEMDYIFITNGHSHFDQSQFSSKDIHASTRQTLNKADDYNLFMAAPNGKLYFLPQNVSRDASIMQPGRPGRTVSKYGTKHLPFNKAINYG